MKTPTALHVSVLLVVLHIGPSYCEEDAKEEGKPQDVKVQPDYRYTDTAQYAYDYDYGANGGGDVANYYQDSSDDYSITDLEKSINCYVCNFHKYPTRVEGTDGCDNPFDQSIVPSILCKSTCSKHLIDTDDGYILIRGCTKNCKDVPATTEGGGYKQCCSSNLCNASPPSLNGPHLATSLSCALLTMLLAHLLR